MRTRTPRAALRRALAPALALACLATGCAAGTGGGRGAEDRIVYAVDTQPDCLDPQISPYDVTAALGRNIFDSLVSVDAEGRVRPWLATSWRVSDDGRTYTFRLREGVRFHDGTALDATAVKATLDHTVAPETKSQYAAGLISMYRSATVVDARTVRVALTRPYTPFLQVLSTATFGIQSPAALRANRGRTCLKPVGSGPFVFAGWDRNRRIDLDRNPRYAWAPPDAGRQGPARVGGLTVEFIPEAASRFGALSSGQVDIATAVPPSHIGRLHHADGFRLLRATQPGAPYTLLFNVGRAPLDDTRVRRALQRSVRLDALVKALYSGAYERSWSTLTPSTTGYAPATEDSWEYDPEEAGRLLDSAGWTGRDADGYRTKDGRRLTVHWPYMNSLMRDQRALLGQGIQAEAQRAGIDLRFTALEPGAYLEKAMGRDADILAFSWNRAEPDIMRSYFDSAQTGDKGGSNAFGLADARLDDWLREASATSDPARRTALYAKAQQRVNEKAYALPVYAPATLVGSADRVRGVTFDAQAYPRFHDARLED
ncbi:MULTISPECIES: ABC transporter substrate-binding protein [unclassified Streptomyces]|uniref:ABC transporter substrate-binding protein n=1 Tax=unclassified Streptomyces TaxID=2593676 RepID=UPI00037F51EC|nr:ABC transporter substrate-binding protein [Streptomyces sp. LaPpAH-202]MYW58238.1 ABC transporter substrate-binding protein [Streptomyces sp. SID8370]MYW86649.1 ABC transporter substrate-binding protein [Streptomyces sp. SID8371]